MGEELLQEGAEQDEPGVGNNYKIFLPTEGSRFSWLEVLEFFR